MATFPQILDNTYDHGGDSPATFSNLLATTITWYNTDTNRMQFTAKVQTVNLLTHCGLVTPYGDRDLGQHWLR